MNILLTLTIITLLAMLIKQYVIKKYNKDAYAITKSYATKDWLIEFFRTFRNVVFGIFLIFMTFAIFESSEKPKENTISEIGKENIEKEINTPTETPSATYTPKEKATYAAYNDFNATDPDFDLGGYCLEKEKKGEISFEECLAVTASKLMSK